MKCILLVRVSTEAQSFEEQKNELVELSRKDGYDGLVVDYKSNITDTEKSKTNDIIVIANKESAIKNDEEHRLGLIEMKEAIDMDATINSVYVWEISRIGRNDNVLSKVKNYLIDKHIQLVVKEPYLRLLNDDMTINNGAELAFSLFSTLAKQEMINKKARFARGKREAVKKGKAPNGSVVYGYAKDEDGYIIIDENKSLYNKKSCADVVRFIFDTYVKSKKSTKAIYRELVELGLIKRLSTEDIGSNKIRRIIMNPCYSGGVSDNGEKRENRIYKYKYPAIVSKELQNKAMEKCKSMKSLPKFLHKNIYYAKSLLKCHCGHTMAANLSSSAYRCPFCKQHISLNMIDYISWNEAIVLSVIFSANRTNLQSAEILKEIETNKQKIKIAQNEIKKLDDKEVRAGTVFINSTLDKNKAENIYMKSINEIKELRLQQKNIILNLEDINRQFIDYLNSLKDKKLPTEQILNIKDDKKRKEIIDSVISSMTISRDDDKHIRIKIHPKISVYPNYQIEYPFEYIYDLTNMPYPHLFRQTIKKGKQEFEDVTKQVEKRFYHYRTRKKYNDNL